MNLSPAATSLLVSILLAMPVCASSPADLFTQGKDHYIKGEFRAAQDCLKRAIANDGKNPAAHYLMGNVLVKLHQVDAAEKEYQSALSLDADGPYGKISQQALDQLAAWRERMATPPLRAEVKSVNNEEKTQEQLAAVQAERDQSLQKIKEEADAQVKRLEAELHGDALPTTPTGGARGRAWKVYANSANAENARDYEKRIQAVKDESKKKIEATSHYYDEKMSAISGH